MLRVPSFSSMDRRCCLGEGIVGKVFADRDDSNTCWKETKPLSSVLTSHDLVEIDRMFHEDPAHFYNCANPTIRAFYTKRIASDTPKSTITDDSLRSDISTGHVDIASCRSSWNSGLSEGILREWRMCHEYQPLRQTLNRTTYLASVPRSIDMTTLTPEMVQSSDMENIRWRRSMDRHAMTFHDLFYSFSDQGIRLTPDEWWIVALLLYKPLFNCAEQYILHRDIKPDNVGISLVNLHRCKEFQSHSFSMENIFTVIHVDLIDWGVGTTGLTMPSDKRVYADSYRPPELDGKHTYGLEADMYATTTTFFAIASGSIAKYSASFQAAQKNLFNPFEHAVAMNAMFPSVGRLSSIDLFRYFQKGLHPDPMRRWTIDEAMHHLETNAPSPDDMYRAFYSLVAKIQKQSSSFQILRSVPTHSVSSSSLSIDSEATVSPFTDVDAEPTELSTAAASASSPASLETLEDGTKCQTWLLPNWSLKHRYAPLDLSMVQSKWIFRTLVELTCQIVPLAKSPFCKYIVLLNAMERYCSIRTMIQQCGMKDHWISDAFLGTKLIERSEPFVKEFASDSAYLSFQLNHDTKRWLRALVYICARQLIDNVTFCVFDSYDCHAMILVYGTILVQRPIRSDSVIDQVISLKEHDDDNWRYYISVGSLSDVWFAFDS